MKIAVLASASVALFGMFLGAIIPYGSAQADSPLVPVVEAKTTAPQPEPQRLPTYGFSVEVLVDGSPLDEYVAHGNRYVEALAGVEYQLRIRNPLPVRAAVALSVDGLNSIDARRTTAWNASKWVIEPYQSITIGGWQMSADRARRFYFTSEKDSYGAKLGQTSNLGNISAVFFREVPPQPATVTPPRGGGREGADSTRTESAPGSSAAPSSSKDTAGLRDNRGAVEQSRKAEIHSNDDYAADDYAATGIGRSVVNDVRWVEMSLERQALAEITVRYEYRAALVRLGILPRGYQRPDPLERREKSTGFAHERYCPEP